MSYETFPELERIIELVSKRLRDHSLPEKEAIELKDWIEHSEKNKRLYEELADPERIRSSADQLAGYNPEPALLRFRTRLKRNRSLSAKRRAYVIAASVALLIGFGGLLYTYKQRRSILDEQEILAGKQAAQLQLHDGTNISLDSLSNGSSASAGGLVINKSANGTLSFTYSTVERLSKATDSYNILATPAGGEYQVILPDGSTVWMNAGSTIKFPSRFHKNKRFVELAGEAFFEIAPDKNRPFIVSTEKQLIEVLGTQFNVQAYNDLPVTKTTLVDGSVRISTSSVKQIIKPGQEARTLGSSENLEIVYGDMNEVLAWKNGYFIFNDENIVDIMKRISRWYDIEVYFEGDLSKAVFAGKFSRKKSLQSLLKSFQSTGKIQFKTKERRVTIMSN